MILVAKSDFVGIYSIAQSMADNIKIQQTIDDNETMIIYELLGKELGDFLIANIQAVKTPITAGPLVVGRSYYISTILGADDFTNVGAASNTAGTYFVATGTTPTSYADASQLIPNRVKRYDDLLNTFYLVNADDNAYETFEWMFCEKMHFRSWSLKDMLLCLLYKIYIRDAQIIHTQSGVASLSVENGRIQPMYNVFRKGASRWNTRGLDTWYAIYWRCKYYSPLVYPEFDGVIGGTFSKVNTGGML